MNQYVEQKFEEGQLEGQRVYVKTITQEQTESSEIIELVEILPFEILTDGLTEESLSLVDGFLFIYNVTLQNTFTQMTELYNAIEKIRKGTVKTLVATSSK